MNNDWNIYYPDIFYNIREISIKNIIKLFYEAKELSTNWWVDELIGPQRQKIEMEFDEIMKFLDNTCHIVFIHRRGYNEWKNINNLPFNKAWSLEIGFSTFKGKQYYLFMYLPEDKIDYFVKKYKLEKSILL